jgi:ketosteroid isomerase-like protein
MRNQRTLTGCMVLLGLLQVSCQTQKTLLTPELRKEIVAQLIEIDDRRSAAADRGDADAALAFISRSPDFRYALDGRLLKGYSEFEPVVRESYAARKSLTSKVKDREVIVLSPDIALNVNRVHHELVQSDGARLSLTVLYGSVWVREAGGWRVIHEYETVVR